MKKMFLLLWSISFLFVCVSCASSQSNVSPKSTATIVKDKAKDFTLKDLDGNSVSLSNLKGKKVFMNFWATWCQPCVQELPDIESIYQENIPDLVIVSINLEQNDTVVKKFMVDKKYNFKVLLDSNGDCSSRYGVNAIPHSFFIDRDGNIVSSRLGGMTREEMHKYIEELGD